MERGTDDTLAAKSKWLWIGENPIPQNVLEASGKLGQLVPFRTDLPLGEQLSETTLVVVHPNGNSKDPSWLGMMLSELQYNTAVAVFLVPPEAHVIKRMLARHQGQFLCASADATPNELAAQFAAAAAIQPVIGKLHEDLSDARKLSAKATNTIEEMGEELRLAARLQRDFLPRRLPEVGRARFGVLYRPLGWVSGDIYDIVRLDEVNIGFYVADVVGHGLPAALLTMFIKKALQTKRIVGNTYEIIPPDVSLKQLNLDIYEQNLSNGQFCTAVYCILDTSTLMLTCARAGHPEPILIHSDGQMERLWAEGSILGIFPEEEFISQRYQLKPGDRIMLYTDGAEDVLCRQNNGEVISMEKALGFWGNLTRDEMLLRLSGSIDSLQDQARPKDDITILLMDLQG